MNSPHVCMLSSLRSSSSDLNGKGASRSSSSLSVPHSYLSPPLTQPKDYSEYFVLLHYVFVMSSFSSLFVFSSPSCVSASRFCCSVAVRHTVPATTLSSRASKVSFALFVLLYFPGSVTGRCRLLTHPFYSTREFGVEKMWRTFCYVCIAGQYLVHCYTGAAKTIIIKFRDFGSEESFWVGFLHVNLLSFTLLRRRQTVYL